MLEAAGIPIDIFFDDVVGAGSLLEAAKSISFLVRLDPSCCGFGIKPMNKVSWIGYDTQTGYIFASGARIE